MISLRQLARLAGVSPSTVVRALKGHDEVAPVTRQRIVQLAKQHHYTPLQRIPEQMLVRQHIIGHILPNFRSVQENVIARALNEECERRHYSWQVRLTEGHMVCVQEAMRHFDDLGVDGLLIHSGAYHPVPAELVRRFHLRGVPVITYDVTPTECPVDWVGTDEIAAGDMAVAYLHGLGHHRIAFLGALSKGHEYGRPHAVYEALVRRNLSTDCFIDVDFKDRDHELAAVLHAPDHPTALIGETDGLALEALSNIRHLGINVPNQLSVLGIGCLPYSAFAHPALTVITLPMEKIAKHAMKLLFARIADPTPLLEGRVEQTAMQPTLIERASCVRNTHRR